MDDSSQIMTAKQYLRRKYTGRVPELKALADSVAESAFESVTITGQSFEGGSAQGQVGFPRMAYLTALEELIIELDPSTPSAASAPSIVNFGSGYIQL